MKRITIDINTENDVILEFMQGCPIDDGPVEVRITEYAPATITRKRWG